MSTNILSSNFLPVNVNTQSFPQAFEELVGRADSISIACGYISSLAIVEIEAILRENAEIHSFDLVIGMHRFDGFTREQYKSANRLNSYLQAKKMGSVKVVTTFPFHGKLYSFSRNGTIFAAVIGSSNLSGILHSHPQYEVDVLSTDPSILRKVLDMFRSLGTTASIDISSLSNLTFNQSNNRALENISDVRHCSQELLAELKGELKELRFRIPVKTTPKSNLNVYFGKGRLNSTTNFIRPRHWYEAEIIVPKEIRRHPEYPCAETEFSVFTDDGWSFDCKVNGDDRKNFRSSKNLQILGRWLKGRLEEAGCLSVGDPVTDDTLSCYGRDFFVLAKTTRPNTWYLDFSQGGSI